MELNLPLLPLRDIVVFPGMIVPLFVGRDKSVVALEKAMAADKEIFLVAQLDPADCVEVVHIRIVFGRIKLGNEENFLIGCHRLFKRNNRFIAANKQRHDHAGENNDIAQRQQRQV